MSSRNHHTSPNNRSDSRAGSSGAVNAKLLICHSNISEQGQTIHEVRDSLTIGRGTRNDIRVDDSFISASHIQIASRDDAHYIVDLNSKNGTFINSIPLKGKHRLANGDVIRAGNCIFVYTNSSLCLRIPQGKQFGVDGDFHGGDIWFELRRAILSPRHTLLVGPSGSGKNHAAHIISKYLNTEMVIHDCASSSLDRIVSDFNQEPSTKHHKKLRENPILDKTIQKILYLDHANCLPMAGQFALAQFVETSTLSVGNQSTEPRPKARIVLSSSEPPPYYGLSMGLVSKLRVVKLPSLKDRAADIPSILRTLIRTIMLNLRLQPEFALNAINPSHYESLLIDDFEGNNIRELAKLAESIATDVAMGLNAGEAIGINLERRPSFIKIKDRYHNRKQIQTSSSSFSRTSLRKASQLGAHVRRKMDYEAHKDLIVELFYQSNQNISQTKRALEDHGYRIDRGTLNKYIKIFWSLPNRRDLRKQATG